MGHAVLGSALSSLESAMHSEVVMTMSTVIVTMMGPAARGPSRATSSGTPMKPVFGKAATSAPKAPSFQPMRAFRLIVTVKATITSAHSNQVKNTPASSNNCCAIGVVAPKRYSMQGGAKNSTKPLSPAMASSGNMRWQGPQCSRPEQVQRESDEQDGEHGGYCHCKREAGPTGNASASMTSDACATWRMKTPARLGPRC